MSKTSQLKMDLISPERENVDKRVRNLIKHISDEWQKFGITRITSVEIGLNSIFSQKLGTRLTIDAMNYH